MHFVFVLLAIGALRLVVLFYLALKLNFLFGLPSSLDTVSQDFEVIVEDKFVASSTLSTGQ